jgi:undecaprenyl-diphosphatase
MDWLAQVLATRAAAAVLLLLVAAFSTARVGWRRTALAFAPALLAIGVTDALGHWILKPGFHRPRPLYFLGPEHVRVLVPGANVGSLPSLHAASAFAAAAALAGRVAVPSTPLWLAAALIAMSRVYGGVHWPSDVLLGAALGLLIGGMVRIATQRALSHGQPRESADASP